MLPTLLFALFSAPALAADHLLAVDTTVAAPGDTITVTISQAPPNRRAYLGVSSSLGDTFCPAVLQGDCLGILPPIALALDGQTDAMGGVTATYTLPADATGALHFESVVLQPGDPSLVAAPVTVTVCSPTPWFADADGDGFGNANAVTTACEAPVGHVANAWDCNDRSGAVFPGAREICDGRDNDCDGLADDDDAGVVGDLLSFADADGDGFGDLDAFTVSCAMPAGNVAAVGDCDDDDVGVSPAGVEVCDGVDNDCDGVVDDGVGDVPFVYPTVQEAVSAGATTLCLSPGTYAGPVTVASALTIDGAGIGQTVFAGDGTGSVFTVAPGASLTLTDVTVTGGAGSLGGGAFCDAGASLTVDRSSFEGNVVTGVQPEGGAIAGDACLLTVTDSVFLDNGAVGESRAFGGAIATGDLAQIRDTAFARSFLEVSDDRAIVRGADVVAGDALLERVVFDDTRVTCAFGCSIGGGSVRVEQDGRVSEADWSRVTLTGGDGDFDITGGVVRLADGGVLTGATIDGVQVDVQGSAEMTLRGGVVDAAHAGPVGSSLVSDLLVTDTRIDLVGADVSVLGGVLYSRDSGGTEAEIRDIVVHGTTLTAAAPFTAASGGVLAARSLDDDMGPVDVRGTTIRGFATVRGGAVQRGAEVDSTIEELVVAGLVVEGATTVLGGALHVFGTSNAGLIDADFVDLQIDGSAVEGAAIHLDSSGGASVYNTNLIDIGATDASASALFVDSGSNQGFLGYSNAFGLSIARDQGVARFAVISADPRYTDRSSSDPAEWDLTLQSSSPCIGAGLVGRDIGAYGPN